MATTNDKEPGKLFDIAKPGTSKPDASARPLIVGHRNMVADPMVAPKAAEPSAKKELKPTTGAGVKIEPMNEVKPEEPTPDAAEPEAESPPADQQPPSPEESESPAAEAAETPAEELPADNQKSKAEAAAEKEAADRQAVAQELIASEKYVLPISEARHGHPGRTFLSVLAVLVVLAAAGYLALDAGLLDLGLELPYEFIKD